MTKFLFLFSILLSSNFTLAQDDRPKVAVSVIVDGANLNHVREVVGEAKALSRKVPVRNFLLIQKMPDMSSMSQDNAKISPSEQQRIQDNVQIMQSAMEEVRILNLEKSEGMTDLSLLDKLRISNSPTLVVRYKGKNYIYEGYGSIDRYFTNGGDFKEAE